jgi:hypothetical protein
MMLRIPRVGLRGLECIPTKTALLAVSSCKGMAVRRKRVAKRLNDSLGVPLQ